MKIQILLILYIEQHQRHKTMHLARQLWYNYRLVIVVSLIIAYHKLALIGTYMGLDQGAHAIVHLTLLGSQQH